MTLKDARGATRVGTLNDDLNWLGGRMSQTDLQDVDATSGDVGLRYHERCAVDIHKPGEAVKTSHRCHSKNLGLTA